MTISQLSGNYAPEEDRILFRLTTKKSDEYRLWFSRAVVKDVLKLGQQALLLSSTRTHLAEHALDMAQFKQQAAAENTKFAEFVPCEQFPLGSEPLLVRGVALLVHTDSTELDMSLAGDKSFKIKLTDTLIGQLMVLLQKLSDNAKWVLEAPTTSEPVMPTLSDSTMAAKKLH